MANPRKPEALKALQGTTRKDRKKEEVAFRLMDSNEPPPELMGPEAIALWHTMSEELMRLNLFAVADVPSLVTYCNTYQSMIIYWREGSSPPGNLLTQFRQLANEFGATPASRSKPVPVADDKKSANPFAKFA
jgi:phage terminase small subunit